MLKDLVSAKTDTPTTTPQLSHELYQQLQDKFIQLRADTKRLYAIEVPTIYVKFNLETQRTLGSIRRHEKHKDCFSARLNLDLLTRYKEVYLDEVVVHEFAHAVCRIIHGAGVSPHGKEWKSIAKSIGLSNPKSTTSTFEVKRDTSNTFKYQCNCDTHYLKKIKHNKNQTHIKMHGKGCYTCFCNSLLIYKQSC